ncbi:hypothetical protein GCM10028827_02430 [Mucilaginibacter myungsuensis]
MKDIFSVETRHLASKVLQVDYVIRFTIAMVNLRGARHELSCLYERTEQYKYKDYSLHNQEK